MALALSREASEARDDSERFALLYLTADVLDTLDALQSS